MEFKHAALIDTEQILDILKSIALDLKSKNIPQWTQWLAPKKSDIKSVKEKIEHNFFFFIKKENQLIGIFSLSDSDKKYWGTQTDKAKYLHSLTILPEYKGQNYGEKVIQKLIVDLQRKEITFLRLDCISTNKTLINYYQSQGFEFIRESEVGGCNFLLHQFTL